MADKLITVKEVAERLAVSSRTVYRLIESGDLPSIQVGPKSRRVSEADLEAFLVKAKQKNLGEEKKD